MEAQAREAAPRRDPWLERRRESFGASEAGALLIRLGHEHPSVPAHVMTASRRLFEVKAGLKSPGKAGQAAARGNDVEADVVQRFNAQVTGWPPVVHASTMPREFLPLVDRVERRMSWTPDGWCRLRGALVVVEVKTDMHGTRAEPDWCWRLQLQQAMAVSGAVVGLLIYAPGWAHWNDSARGELVTWAVERDDHTIATLRHACATGWAQVEEMRARAK